MKALVGPPLGQIDHMRIVEAREALEGNFFWCTAKDGHRDTLVQ